MGGGNRLVVVDDRDDVDDVVHEGLPVGAVDVIGQVHSDQQLGDGDGGDRRVVVIGDQVIEGRSRAVSVDEEGGVEEEPAQGRCSISRSSRIEVTSREKAGSEWWRRRSAFTSAPLPACTGSSWATTLPRRTIVKCSPRCSTASSRSEKLRAASVALTSGTRSDYQTEPIRTWACRSQANSRALARLAQNRRSASPKSLCWPPARERRWSVSWRGEGGCPWAPTDPGALRGARRRRESRVQPSPPPTHSFIGRNVGSPRAPEYENPPRTLLYDKCATLYQPLPAPSPEGLVLVVEGTLDAMAIAVTALRAGQGERYCPLTQSGR